MAVKSSKTKDQGRSGGISQLGGTLDSRGRGIGIGFKPSCRGVGNGKANTTAHPEFPDKAV